MLSEEGIEEYKETLYDLISDEDVYNSIKNAVKGTFSYIDQLEQENNKQNKIIDEITKEYIDKTIPKISQCQNKELRKYLLESYNNGEVDSIFCKIKQYFEKKVEEK